MKWTLPALCMPLCMLTVSCGSDSDSDGDPMMTQDDPPGTPSQEPLPNVSGSNNASNDLQGRTWAKCVNHSSHKLPSFATDGATVPYSKLKFKIFGTDGSYTRVDYYFYNQGCTDEIYKKKQYFGTHTLPGSTSNAVLNGTAIQVQDIDMTITTYLRTYFQTSRGDEAMSYDNSHCRLSNWQAGVARDMIAEQAHCARNYGPGKTIFEITYVNLPEMFFGHSTSQHDTHHGAASRPVEVGSHYFDWNNWPASAGTRPPQPATFAADTTRP